MDSSFDICAIYPIVESILVSSMWRYDTHLDDQSRGEGFWWLDCENGEKVRVLEEFVAELQHLYDATFDEKEIVALVKELSEKGVPLKFVRFWRTELSDDKLYHHIAQKMAMLRRAAVLTRLLRYKAWLAFEGGKR